MPSKAKAKAFHPSHVLPILSTGKAQTFKQKAQAREEQKPHTRPQGCLSWRDYLVKVSLDNSHGESAE